MRTTVKSNNYRRTGRGNAAARTASVRTPYVYGSAAPRMEEQSYVSPQQERKAVREAQRSRHMNPGYVLFMIAAMALMCFILISYISLHAQLISSVKDISSLEQQLITLREANDEKENAIRSATDIDEIRETALTKLGMKYAEKDQIITYHVETTDYVRQVADIK